MFPISTPSGTGLCSSDSSFSLLMPTPRTYQSLSFTINKLYRTVLPVTVYIQGVSRGTVNILGGGSMDYSE